MAKHVNYRKSAFENYDPVCAHCGFGIESVLEVAHIDGNRNNNEVSNLVILCPNCHKMHDLDIISTEVIIEMRDRPKKVDWSKRMKDAGKRAALTRKRKLAAKKAAETRRNKQANMMSDKVAISEMIPDENVQAPRSSVIRLRRGLHIRNGKQSKKELPTVKR